jgi:hypothetical protein
VKNLRVSGGLWAVFRTRWDNFASGREQCRGRKSSPVNHQHQFFIYCTCTSGHQHGINANKARPQPKNYSTGIFSSELLGRQESFCNCLPDLDVETTHGILPVTAVRRRPNLLMLGCASQWSDCIKPEVLELFP